MNTQPNQPLVAARRFDALLFASASIVWWTNPTGEFVEEQPHWQAYTGQTWEEYRGGRWISAVHPDDRSAITRDWTSAVASASPYFTQGRIWSAKHKGYRAFQSRGIAIGNEAGAVEEWLGALTDIQDSIDIKLLLARAQEDLAQSFNSLRVSEARLREQDARLEHEAAALRRLNELVLRLWKTPELAPGLNQILRATIELLSADKGDIRQFDSGRRVLTIVAQQGFDQNIPGDFSEVTVGDGSVCARALESAKRIIVEDVQMDDAYALMRAAAEKNGFRAVQSTPLFGHDGSVIGVMSTHFCNAHRPTPHELALLDLYAQQASNFIERARMDAEQKQRADQVRLLLREVNHRSKNMLTVVQAIARHSIRGNPAGFIADFEKRLQALARSQDLIVLSEWKGVQMEDIVRAQLAHVGRDARQRIVIDGEPVVVTPAAAQSFSMAVHELVTNAGKYGTLSTPEGSVSVSWGFVHDETDRQFRFAWAEQGGPPVEQPHGRGFGTTVLETIAARALSASVVMDYRSEGFAWRLRCPAQSVTSQQE